MPAIQITRLRIQVARLLEHFDQPEKFGRSLADLLDYYSDRARRTGKLTALAPIQKQYRVHPAVLKQISDDITPYCRERPEQAAALAEYLWHDSHYEPRLLAAGILSMLPDEAWELITDKLTGWARPGQDRVLIDALLTEDIGSPDGNKRQIVPQGDRDLVKGYQPAAAVDRLAGFLSLCPTAARRSAAGCL